MKQKGFTLVEIVVVIVIIAILAAVVIPTFNKAIVNVPCINELVICPKCNTSLVGIKPECGEFQCYKKCSHCGYKSNGLPFDKCNKEGE